MYFYRYYQRKFSRAANCSGKFILYLPGPRNNNAYGQWCE
jgi:hypothetical protein